MPFWIRPCGSGRHGGHDHAPRTFSRVLFSHFLALTVVAIAQPPTATTTPPPVVVVPPVDPVPPAPPKRLQNESTAPPSLPSPAAGTPLSQFEPLAAFPQQTQNAVRAVLLGANWMTRMNQPQGRFLFGYNPALREPMLGDHDLKQARGALALAQAAKFSGDEKQAAVASQAILTLLAATKIDPADPNCRVPVHSSLCATASGSRRSSRWRSTNSRRRREARRRGRAALRVPPQAVPHRRLGPLHRRPDRRPPKIDPDGVNEYPGLALHAIIVGNRVRPAAWKTEVGEEGDGALPRQFGRSRTRCWPRRSRRRAPSCTFQTK